MLILGNGGETELTMHMVGEGERAESTCLRKNRRILGRVRVSRGCGRTLTLSWERQPTLYAILVRGLDLCQDYFSRKGSEDGHPKDNYDIVSKGRQAREDTVVRSRL